MKKFAKKPLAITATALMLAFGGMVSMAHASDVLYSQNIAADKLIRQGGAVKIKFMPSSAEVFSGKQADDTVLYVLKISDSAEHTGWRIVPTGKSEGGYAYDDNDGRINLHGALMTWTGGSEQSWHKDDSTNRELEEHLYAPKGTVIKAGTYHFSGRVEEYL
ncbi:hypothetical protein CBW58_04270 [Yersinia frederiksenii]|nr:hypothetical protein CBW58_04270 [Yersinia frederiksenii]